MNDIPLKQDGPIVGWIAFYNGKQIEIPKTDNVRSLWDAKKEAIDALRVPKKKQGLVSVIPATD